MVPRFSFCIKIVFWCEFGHRTRDHKDWIKGRFMLTISVQEIQNVAPAIIEKKLKEQLEEVFR